MRIGVFPCLGTCVMHETSIQNVVYNTMSSMSVDIVPVRHVSLFETLDALIIPSAPASALRRLMMLPPWDEALHAYIVSGKPLWMTGEATALIRDGKVLDEEALFQRLHGSSVHRRTAFGSGPQRFVIPFRETLSIAHIAEAYQALFVQWVEHAPRATMHILSKWRDHPVVFWEKQFFYTVFSPELCSDGRIHEYFLHYVAMFR